MTKLERLIAEAEETRQLHKRAGRQIEAAAAAIRLRALQDARDAING
jgi:hypothetical protein